jgi:hypothetical protein
VDRRTAGTTNRVLGAVNREAQGTTNRIPAIANHNLPGTTNAARLGNPNRGIANFR